MVGTAAAEHASLLLPASPPPLLFAYYDGDDVRERDAQASGMEEEPAWGAREEKSPCKTALGGYLTGFNYFRV